MRTRMMKTGVALMGLWAAGACTEDAQQTAEPKAPPASLAQAIAPEPMPEPAAPEPAAADQALEGEHPELPFNVFPTVAADDPSLLEDALEFNVFPSVSIDEMAEDGEGDALVEQAEVAEADAP